MRVKYLPKFNYTNLFWLTSIVCGVFLVLDRLTLHWTCSIMEADCAVKIPSYRAASWFTQVFWIVTARTLIVSANISFATILWVIPNFLEEVLPQCMETNIRQNNLKIHSFTGIWLNGVVVVVHSLLLFSPTVVHGVPFKVHYDGFDSSHWWDPVVRTVTGFITPDLIHCTVDELWRTAMMILAFCILFPLSRSAWMLRRSYSTAMWVHVIAGVYFMVDQIRTSTHHLSHTTNIPFLALWIADRVVATCLYRVGPMAVHKVETCGKSCFILYGLIPGVEMDDHGCGDNYWLLHRFNSKSICYPKWQRSHPYNSFHNPDIRTRHLWNVAFVCNANLANKDSWTKWLMSSEIEKITKFPNQFQSNILIDNSLQLTAIKYNKDEFQNIDLSDSPKKESRLSTEYSEKSAELRSQLWSLGRPKTPDNDVSGGIVNPAFCDDKEDTKDESVLEIPGSPEKSHRMYSTKFSVTEIDEEGPRTIQKDLRTWGPYRSAFYAIRPGLEYKKMVLIASGSGYAYIISALSLLGSESEKTEDFSRITVHYSTRERGLLESFCRILATIPRFEHCNFVIHYTGSNFDTDDSRVMTQPLLSPELSKHFTVQHGRADFAKFLSDFENRDGTIVYSCGAKILSDEIERICSRKNIESRCEGY